MRVFVHILILAAAGGVFWVLGHGTLSVVLWCLAAALLALGFVAPSIQKALLGFGAEIGKLVGHGTAVVLLTVLFYTVFVWGALWLRMCGKDPMARDFPGDDESYWLMRSNHPPDAAAYLRPYSHPHAGPSGRATS